MVTNGTLLHNLFRQEFSKIVAVISKQFGLQHIELAEDIVADTFLQAAESWAQRGIPPSPEAWLYTVARQKILYHFRRKKILDEKVIPKVKEDHAVVDNSYSLEFTQGNITDSQLKMMFAICNPALASESQVGLALRILCGFGIEEIAEAFLTNKETINKRLFRAKEKLRTERISLDLPSTAEIEARLDNVLRVIYLLFNEGYHSASQNYALQKDFCLEALRLGILLTENEATNLPKTNALIALMCFHTSRFEARSKNNDETILYDNQDVSLWNAELIIMGNEYLAKAAKGKSLSSYHLEAGIAFWHSQKQDTREKWEMILKHYDLLLQMNYSPVIALNRLYAFYKVFGNKMALAEVSKLNLPESHYYHTLLGELYGAGDKTKANQHFQRALTAARAERDRQVILQKIERLRS